MGVKDPIETNCAFKRDEAMSKIGCLLLLSVHHFPIIFLSLPLLSDSLCDSSFSVWFLLLRLCSIYLQSFLRRKHGRTGMPRQFYASIQKLQHHQPREAICGLLPAYLPLCFMDNYKSSYGCSISLMTYSHLNLLKLIIYCQK